MKREIRSAHVRALEEETRTFEAVACVYNVVDEYGTRFLPGCFAESIAERMPKVAWSHDWSDPIGRVIDAKDVGNELIVICELDNPDDVPRVRQAVAQLISKTIEDVSVGFSIEADQRGDDGVREFLKCTLDEVSLVLRGAVPGAKILAMRRSVRAGSGMVDEELVVSLARKVAAKEMTEEEAKIALGLAEVEDVPAEAEETDEGNDAEGPKEGQDGEGEKEQEPEVEVDNDEIADSIGVALAASA